MSTKLILVEGLPGSGKTTMAEFVRDEAAQHGRAPLLYLEGNLDHPADFESVAYLNAAAYGAVLEDYPDWREPLEAEAEVRGEDRFIGYRKLAQGPGPAWPEALLRRLAAHEIYEQSPETFQRLVAARWQAFVDGALAAEQVYIFECCFLQNPLTMLLGRHAEPVSAAEAFVLRLAQIVQPLDPLLIYLDPGQARPTLERVAKTRPPEWLEFVMAYHTKQGTGRARGWAGFDGLVKFCEMRQAIELALLPRLPWPHLRVPHADWAADRLQVAAFLESAAIF
jgi:hypothetical protein